MKRITSAELRRKRAAGFTITELLVVISIIALLAGLLIGVYPLVNEKKIRSRVKAELTALAAVIDHYHADKGFYPPAVTNAAGYLTLYYELTGSGDKNDAMKFDPALGGFLNSDADRKNFQPSLKPNQFKQIGDVLVLGVATKGPEGDFSTWHYDASSPNRKNHEAYDLWTDVIIGGKTVRIGNWRD